MGIFQPPPSPPSPSDFPAIAPAKYEDAARQAAAGVKKGGFWDDLLLKGWNFFHEGMIIVIKFIVGAVDFYASFFVEGLTNMQGTGEPGMLRLMNAVLGDMLGIEFEPNELIRSFQKGGRIGAMTKAGGWLFDTLMKEFQPAGSTTVNTATTAPAKSFLGFLLEFAVREGNLAYLAEIIPMELSPFWGLREYGELLGKNLGLGRLARQALRPLMQVMIADPLNWALNHQYRPKMLSEGEAIKAFHHGQIDDAELHKILGYAGYSDHYIDVLTAQQVFAWPAHVLLELYKLGVLDDAEIPGMLVSDRVDGKMAAGIWGATKQAAADSLQDGYLNELLHQVRSGFRPPGYIQTEIDAAKLTPDEREQWHHIVGSMMEVPRKHITEAELERAFLGGILDLSAVQSTWQALGYSFTDQQTLTLLLLQKQSSSNRTRGGHAPHKSLTEAQLEKAYNSGVIDLAQLQNGWHALGYSPDDVNVLTALVTAKTAPPGQTQFPGMTTP